MPNKDKKTISVRFDIEEVETLADYAEANDLTVSQVIRKAVKEFFKDKALVED